MTIHNRQRKLAAELQRALAQLIGREVKDPRVGNITITHVALAGDLASARVYFVPFASTQPPEHSPREVCAGLARAAGFLRGAVGRHLGLRYTPRLEFVFDETPAQADRLSQLIDRAVDPDRAAGARRERPADS